MYIYIYMYITYTYIYIIRTYIYLSKHELFMSHMRMRHVTCMHES